MLRAIRDEIGDDERLPRSLTLHYLRPPAEGDAEIEVTVERDGEVGDDLLGADRPGRPDDDARRSACSATTTSRR